MWQCRNVFVSTHLIPPMCQYQIWSHIEVHIDTKFNVKSRSKSMSFFSSHQGWNPCEFLPQVEVQVDMNFDLQSMSNLMLNFRLKSRSKLMSNLTSNRGWNWYQFGLQITVQLDIKFDVTSAVILISTLTLSRDPSNQIRSEAPSKHASTNRKTLRSSTDGSGNALKMSTLLRPIFSEGDRRFWSRLVASNESNKSTS